MANGAIDDALGYDESEASREEAIHETPAAVARRRLVRENLGLRTGEAVLSIGCGPGFEPAEVAAVVGSGWNVLGIDSSEAMLALARRRCGALSQAALTRADAVDLPVADASFDAAIAVQVYEYLEDVRTALEELARVLRPGGRAVVYDTDFDSVVWRSTDRERMQRILDTFENHCPRPHLGSELAPYLRDAGLTVERIVPNSIVNTPLDEDTFAYRLLNARREYVVDRGIVERAEAYRWVEDLRELDEAGGTFFDLTQYLYVVRKPA